MKFSPARQLLPAEWVLLCGLAAFGIFLLFGYPLLVPAPEGGEILMLLGNTTKHAYFVLFAIVLYAAVTMLRAFLRKEKISWKTIRADSIVFLRLMVCITICMYLMICFKWWAHLHGRLYDAEYWAIDEKFIGLKRAILGIDDIVYIHPYNYFRAFGCIFIFTYMLAVGTKPAMFARMVTVTCVVAIFGGLLYMPFPAYGPLLFERSPNELMALTQGIMFDQTDAFRSSGGQNFNPERFEVVLGAMPSLHVGHTLALTYYCFRVHWTAGLFFTLVTIYITLYAVITHFHYLVDLPIGALVGIAAIVMTEKLYRWYRPSAV